MKKKNKIRINLLIVMGIIFSLSTSCKKGEIPIVITADVIGITESAATCGGTIISDGGSAVTASGVCWSIGEIPTTDDNKTTDGTSKGSFTSSMAGLTANTICYVRAYATNEAGTAYGNTVSFSTHQNTVTDYDGNVYHTLTIGTQVWMAENLRVTHYRNGSIIPEVTDNTSWSALTTGAYCGYDNSTFYSDIYGMLYNWYAVQDSRNIAPIGWHIPSDAEWTILFDYLGGEFVAGGKLKETGTTHWVSPNTGATNEKGFTALPGGIRGPDGVFSLLGNNGCWWSSTEDISGSAYGPIIYSGINSTSLSIYYKNAALSVRCLKD